MNYYAYFILIILICRFIYQNDETQMSFTQLLIKSAIEILALLVFIPNSRYIPIILVILILNFLSWITERHVGIRNICRFIILIIYFVAFGFLCSNAESYLHLRSLIVSFIDLLKNNILFQYCTKLGLLKFVIYVIGALIISEEANNVIRHILSSISIEPVTNKKTDTDELSRGRIIGIIERLLIYYFVINNSYESIAFILTAKAFARFKKLDDKDFAEYVLIGTLLSTAIAIFCGVTIKFIISKI